MSMIKRAESSDDALLLLTPHANFNINIIFFLFCRKCIASKELKTEAEVETFLLTLRVSMLQLN